MYRGTTPVHTFLVPFAPSDIANIYLTYSQNDETIVEKSLDGLEIKEVEDEENTALVVAHLTQANTLAFEVGVTFIQIRIYDRHGEAFASQQVRERVQEILKDGVIGGQNG